MNTQKTRKTTLNQDQQFEKWSNQYNIDTPSFRCLSQCIDQNLTTNEFHCLDVGGGAGRFGDLILDAYPHSQVTILDNSDYLLRQNSQSSRKTTIHADAFEVNKVFQNKDHSFDIVILNHVIHHFIGDSYAETISIQKDILAKIFMGLPDKSYVFIVENAYNGVYFNDLPGKIIYKLTSLKNFVTPLVKRLGANTAGTGVCFHSNKFWENLFLEIGFKIVYQDCIQDRNYRHGLIKKALLHIGSLNLTGYLLTKPN